MHGTYGINTGIKEYKDLYNVGLGKYNTLYETLAYDADGNFMKDANGNYVTERYKLADGTLWDKTTDNFWQNHNILSAACDINEHWSTTASLHYTHGYGYYKEFRLNNKLKKYGLNNFTLSDGSTLKKTDFVRKKGLTQDTYGMVGNVNYKDDSWDVIGGLSVQQFDGNHFGYLTYIKNEELRNHLMSKGDYQYYDSDAKKLDASAFIKALFHIDDSWDVFGDMQYRHVGYKTDGYNDKFYEDENTGEIKKHYLDIDKKYDFFNPKAGVSFHQDGHRAFFSAALSHREPERNNFTDNGSYPAPKAESLLDFELGYSYGAQNWRAGATLYYMDYTDQFVQTGAQSDIGEALTTNIKDSYRMGVELTAGVDLTPWLSIEGNAALSQNKIKDFDEVVEDWDNGSQNIHYDNSTLAFSPSTILNGFVNFHLKGWTATWHTGYVSRMYLDNTENKDRSLPGYSVSNFNLNYSLPVKKFLKEIVFGANINNIFNQHFAQSGWVYSAIYSSGGHPNDNRYYQIGYVPSAGITAMGSITLRF
jgi:iron complex outermembrane receptor protein